MAAAVQELAEAVNSLKDRPVEVTMPDSGLAAQITALTNAVRDIKDHPVEVTKEVIKEVPGPERIVTKEVIKEVPGPERIVEKEVRVVKEVAVPGPEVVRTEYVEVEKPTLDQQAFEQARAEVIRNDPTRYRPVMQMFDAYYQQYKAGHMKVQNN